MIANLLSKNNSKFVILIRLFFVIENTELLIYTKGMSKTFRFYAENVLE